MDGNAAYGLALIAMPLLLSLTLHEYGHARTAQAFGDHTARLLGRCSLNPLVHLDLVGTICFFFGPVGWAKPVPVDFSRLRPARMGDLAVSLAGVGMNLLLAAGAVAGLYLMVGLGVSIDPGRDAPPTPAGVGAFMLSYALLINLALLLFNLIPLFPLDGHHVVRELLPWDRRSGYMQWQGRLGQFALLALLGIPWLLGNVGLRVFNPVGYLLTAVIDPLVRGVLNEPTYYLFIAARYRYGVYLTW
jgi:Zn-dependent protease